MRPDPLSTPPQGGPTLSRAASESLAPRRRGRNIALFAVLLALVVLFYFMTIAKMTPQHRNDAVTPSTEAPR